MLTFIHEAGWFSWITVAVVAVGLVRLSMTWRTADRSGPVAATWAATAMALALVGASGGQHKVDAAVQRETDPARQTLLVSIGTREASSNLMIGGLGALLLLSVGGALALRQRQPTSSTAR